MDKAIPIIVASIFAIGAFFFTARRAEGSTVNETPKETHTADDDRPRGIRNNNPGNIEDSGIEWRGLVGNDGRYAIFSAPEWGMRALLINLHSYFTIHNLDTVRDIIGRWAPEHENPTGNYVEFVARKLSVSPDQPLQYRAVAIDLARAITEFENGSDPYDMDQWQQAGMLSGKL